MGAQLWHHPAPWRPNPAEALFELQGRFLAETYDLPGLVQTHLQGAREAVRLTESEGDPYELLDLYRRELALLEEVSSRPLPQQPPEQIELLRQLYANSGEGIGNVLDVTTVSDEGGIHIARRLRPDEVHELCGSERPTRGQAEAAVFKINERLRRGESVCFPVYSEDATETPVGWYFVGNTID